jgi:hypothetical protein
VLTADQSDDDDDDDERYGDDERDATVLMPMNYTNTTAEEIETLSLRSSSAPFFKMDEQFDPVDYAMTFSATLRAHTLSVFQQLEANYSHMINDTQQDASDIDTVPLCSIRAPILLILLYAYTIYLSKITDKTIKMHATIYRFALSSPIIGVTMFLVSFSVAGIAIITHAICIFSHISLWPHMVLCNRHTSVANSLVLLPDVLN